MSMSDKTAAAPTPPEVYRAALDAGRLTFQCCSACGNKWLPPREDCPRCWSADWEWKGASGGCEVVSWVVYHIAFDKRFAGRLPYNVALVQLDEGPRMITNLVDLADEDDVIGRRARLVFEEDMGRCLPRFRLTEKAGARERDPVE